MSTTHDLVTAAESGDELAMQVAMRRIVAERIADPKCPSRELASLTKRLHEINREIKSLKECEEEEDAITPDEPFDPSAL